MPRNDDFSYELQNKSGTKQDPGSQKIEKVVVYLKGSKASVATKLAKEFEDIDLQMKKLAEQKSKVKEKIIPFVEDLFDIQDSVWTRVVDTAGVLLALSRASTRNNFDSKKFIEKIAKEFPNLKARFDEIAKECTNVINVASKVNVKIKNEGVGDAIKVVFEKIQTQITNFVEKIKKFLLGYDKKLSGWKSEIISNIQIENHNILMTKTNKFIDRFMD